MLIARELLISHMVNKDCINENRKLKARHKTGYNEMFNKQRRLFFNWENLSYSQLTVESINYRNSLNYQENSLRFNQVVC